MKNRKILSVIIATALMVSVVGCGKNEVSKNNTISGAADSVTQNAETQNAETTKELKTFILANAGGDTNDLVNLDGIAQKQGYFEEELAKVGYKYELKGFAGHGPEVNEAFASGAVDVAGYGCIPFVVSHANDIDTTLIGVGSAETNYTLVVQPDVEINTPKDFEGKKIIMPEGTANQYVWEKYVEEYDIDVSKVELINNSADARAIFEAGEADGWVANDSSARIYESQGKAKVIFSSSERPEWASSSVLVVRTAFLKENPDVAVALLKAYIRAEKYIEEHANLETYEALSGGVVTDEAVGEKVYNLHNGDFSYFNGDPSKEKVDYLQNLSDFLAEKGFIRKTLNVRDFVDTSYYEKAKSELESEGFFN